MMEEHTQDWGRIIGAGIVVLGALAIAVNLTVFDMPAELLEKLDVPPLWLQFGRWSGLVVTLGVGSVLLWRMILPKQPVKGASLQRATGYIQRIEKLLKTNPNEHQQQLLTQIHTWQRAIETTVRTLAGLAQNNHIIEDDLRRLPNTITDLERQLTEEASPLLRTDLAQMLLQRKNQQRSLEQLQTTRRRAEIQVERATVVLGTIYSQLLTYRSTSHVADYQRLVDDVAQEVQHLQDYLEALYDWRDRKLDSSPKNRA
jgi:septal ring factor EnvC (AmiA/AmiB activator)